MESDLDVRAFAKRRGAGFDQRPAHLPEPLRDAAFPRIRRSVCTFDRSSRRAAHSRVLELPAVTPQCYASVMDPMPSVPPGGLVLLWSVATSKGPRDAGSRDTHLQALRRAVQDGGRMGTRTGSAEHADDAEVMVK